MDILGKALLEYYEGRRGRLLTSHSTLGTSEEVDPGYFFRGFEQMPDLEQQALVLARGRTLDVGCGAGSHALYLQQTGLDCHGLDPSPGALAVARARGLQKASESAILDFQVGNFDTVLLLMNGAGLAGTLADLAPLLRHLASLLAPGGQILLDSSDIIYMFDEDADGGVWVPGEPAYYGEVRYRWEYQGSEGPEFPWLFVDFARLREAAGLAGLQAELLGEGPHFDYLARLTLAAYQPEHSGVTTKQRL